MPKPPSLLRRSLGVIALLAAMALAVSLATQISDQLRNDDFVPEEYFSYFTIQTSVANLAALIAVGVFNLRSAIESVTLLAIRHSLMAYAVVTGSVYNLLLRGPADLQDVLAEITSPNEIFHVVIPIYLVADWVFSPHGARLPLRVIGLGLIYPMTWVVFTVLRGQLTGWYPYEFLDPGEPDGWVGVWTHVAGIALLITALLALGLWINRLYCRIRGI